MKKTVLFILLIQLLVATVYADKINGKIIYVNDTLEVIFFIPIDYKNNTPKLSSLQSKITYIDSTEEKVKLKPNKSIILIEFQYNNKPFKIHSLLNTLDVGSLRNDYIFLTLENEIDSGRIKLFNYYYGSNTNLTTPFQEGTSQNISGNNSQIKINILQIDNGKLISSNDPQFERTMMEYFKLNR